ncbi:MAG: asparagine synthase (glutamine-hydrolyzing) [Actinomycetota bacterium]|nr:asparagine synthase (glutamine-hydrolyzing) [Actinomycetota bacterium]
MCGIAGWVDWGRDLTGHRPVAQAMTDTMACRGPDDEGLWVSSRAALGHRRLAVIDVEGGKQPMAAERAGSAVVLTYSGEVYNFGELRQELESRGHRFRTRCDTEVVLRSYLEWGADCADRLNGMFAFAIWDEERQELVLARDRFGIKPLYYFSFPTGLLFGSEPKALLANPLFPAEVDATGLAELFGLNKGRTPGHGVFRGLREVLPGCTVRVDSHGAHVHRYYGLSSRPHEDDEKTTVDTVRGLLEDIVERNLVADVPLCTLLSGGLDSSVVAALAAGSLDRQGLGPPVTFAVDFENNEAFFRSSAQRPSLDGPFVHLMAEHLGAKHTDVVLSPGDLFTQQQHTLGARDLPGHGDMDASLYLLCREVRRHSTVALSGEGADEVFGGYPWFRDLPPETMRNFPWRTTIPDIADLLSDEARTSIRLDEYVADRYDEALAEVPHLDGEQGVDRRIRELSYLTLTRYLPLMLDRKDRMSMAVGLEVRVPFCDHRLVDYVWNVPWSMRTVGDMEKGLLRRAATDVLPAEVVNRRKSGFPAIQDPAYDEALMARLKEWMADRSSPLDPLVDRQRLAALVDDDQVAGVGWRRSRALAKNLLEVDGWMRRYGVSIR